MRRILVPLLLLAACAEEEPAPPAGDQPDSVTAESLLEAHGVVASQISSARGAAARMRRTHFVAFESGAAGPQVRPYVDSDSDRALGTTDEALGEGVLLGRGIEVIRAPEWIAVAPSGYAAYPAGFAAGAGYDAAMATEGPDFPDPASADIVLGIRGGTVRLYVDIDEATGLIRAQRMFGR